MAHDYDIDRDSLTSLLADTAKPEGGAHALLFGPRGTGKTTTACAAALPDQKVVSVTLTSEQPAASLWGHFIPRGNDFVWQDGPVLQAWRSGGLLVINEIDHASEDVSNLLHVALDDPEVAQVTLPTGETVRPARGFRCIATMNGGVDMLAPAVTDRFTIALPVNQPSTEMIGALPEDLRAETRWQYDHLDPDTGDSWITYREMRSFAGFRARTDDVTAASLVFGADTVRAGRLVNAVRSSKDAVAWDAKYGAKAAQMRTEYEQLLSTVSRERNEREWQADVWRDEQVDALHDRYNRMGWMEKRKAPPMEDEELRISDQYEHKRWEAREWRHAEIEAAERSYGSIPARPGQTHAMRRDAQQEYDRYGDPVPAPRSDSLVKVLDRNRVSDLLAGTADPEGGNHALLFGPRGTGKTTVATRSALPGQEVYSVTLTAEQPAASLWGHYVPRGNEFVWQDGPVLQAWRSGGLLVINEIDHASEDVSNLLHVVLDNPQVAEITLPTGETVRPQRGFRCIATMNGGTEELAPAVLDRFSITTPVNEPSKEMIKALPRDLRDEAEWQYAHVDAETGEPALTYRELAAFGRLREKVGEQRGAALALGGEIGKAHALVRTLQHERDDDGSRSHVTQRSVGTRDVIDEIPRDDLSTLLRQTADVKDANHVLLYGPRGTGKTTAACAAHDINQNVVSVTLTAEQSAASLWGHYVPRGNEFVWQDGPVLQAWRSGGLLVINEVDHASEDVSNLLHVVLDNPEVAKITLPTGETVRPQQGFRCIATMNGTPADLAPAVLDRFAIATDVDRPSSQMIAALPEDIRQFASYLYSDRNHDRAESGEPSVTYRDLQDFAELRGKEPEKVAAVMALEGDVRRAAAVVEAVSLARVKAQQEADRAAAQAKTGAENDLKGRPQPAAPRASRPAPAYSGLELS